MNKTKAIRYGLERVENTKKIVDGIGATTFPSYESVFEDGLIKQGYCIDELEPNGGNMFKQHVMMVDSGTFWRCKHGDTGYKGMCSSCLKDHLNEILTQYADSKEKENAS
jgi:hypothetical protein